MAKKDKKKGEDQVRYGIAPWQVGPASDTTIQSFTAPQDTSEGYRQKFGIPSESAEPTVTNISEGLDVPAAAVGEALGVEGPRQGEREPTITEASKGNWYLKQSLSEIGGAEGPKKPAPEGFEYDNILSREERADLSQDAVFQQQRFDAYEADYLSKSDDPLNKEYYPMDENSITGVATMSRYRALQALPMELANDWDKAQDFSYENYPTLMMAGHEAGLNAREMRDLVNITLAVDTVRMIGSSASPMRQREILNALPEYQEALVLDIMTAMQAEQVQRQPMNEVAMGSGEAPGQSKASAAQVKQNEQQNPIARAVSDYLVTPSIDLPGTVADNVDYGPIKDGRVYPLGTGIWKTFIDFTDDTMQGLRTGFLRGTSDSWSEAWDRATMGTFDPEMVSVIKENNDPLMVDVALAMKKAAHSGSEDPLGDVISQFEGNMQAINHIDGFIANRAGSKYEEVSNVLDMAETGNLGALAVWMGTNIDPSSAKVGGPAAEAMADTLNALGFDPLDYSSLNYDDMKTLGENAIVRSLMQTTNLTAVFATDPFLIGGLLGKGVRVARFGLHRMGEGSASFNKVWNKKAVQRYWNNLGKQFDDIRTLSDEAEKAKRLNSIASQNKNWFSDRSAIYTMYAMGVKDAKTARQFLDDGDNIQMLLAGQAAKRSTNRYVPHQGAVLAVTKAGMLLLRGKLGGPNAAKQVDEVFGEGTSQMLPEEALPKIVKMLEEDPAAAAKILNDFRYTDDGFAVRTLTGRVVDFITRTERVGPSTSPRDKARIEAKFDKERDEIIRQSREKDGNPAKAVKTRHRYGWKRKGSKINPKTYLSIFRRANLAARQYMTRKPVHAMSGRDGNEVKKMLQGYGMSTQFANYIEYLWRSPKLTAAERHQLVQGINKTAIFSSGLDLAAPGLARSILETYTTVAARAGTKYAADQLDVVSIRARAEDRVRSENNARREANMAEFTAQEAADQIQRAVDDITEQELRRLEAERAAAVKAAKEFEARLASAPDEGMPATPQDLIPESPTITKAQAIAAGKHVKETYPDSWNFTSREHGTKSNEKLGRLFIAADPDSFVRLGIIPGTTDEFVEQTVEVTLPPRYWSDAHSRLETLRLVEDEDLVVKETKRGTTVRLTADQYDDIMGDLDFYLDGNIMDEMNLHPGVIASFKAAQKRMAAIERPSAAADEAAPKTSFPAVVRDGEVSVDWLATIPGNRITPGPAKGIEGDFDKAKAGRVTLEFDTSTGRILVSEGNHRVAAALEAGVETLPVKIDRVKSISDERVRAVEKKGGSVGNVGARPDIEWRGGPEGFEPEEILVRQADEAAPVADDLPPVEIPARTTEQIDSWLEQTNRPGDEGSQLAPVFDRDTFRPLMDRYNGPSAKPAVSITAKSGKTRGANEETAEFHVYPEPYDPEDGAWVVQHTAHGYGVQVGTQRAAVDFTKEPATFCEKCALVETAIAKGYVVNDGGILVFADEALGRTVPESPYASLADARASVGNLDGLDKAVRDDVAEARARGEVTNPSSLNETDNYALHKYQTSEYVRMLDPTSLERFAVRSSYLNALLGNNNAITSVVDMWTLATLAGPRFVMRSGLEDWVLFAATGGKIFGENSWWANRRRSRAIREATNDDPLEGFRVTNRRNEGKKIGIASAVSRNIGDAVQGVPFLRSLIIPWLTPEEVQYASRQATKKGIDERSRVPLANLVATAIARSRYWSRRGSSFLEYRRTLNELRDDLAVAKNKRTRATDPYEINRANAEVKSIEEAIDAHIEYGIDGLPTREADDIIAKGVEYGHLNRNMDAASETGSSLASGTRPYRPSDEMNLAPAALRNQDGSIKPGLLDELEDDGKARVFKGVSTERPTYSLDADNNKLWDADKVADLLQELNGFLHTQDQVSYLAVALSKKYYDLRVAVAKGQKDAQKNLDDFLREQADRIPQEELDMFVLASPENLGPQGYVQRVFESVLRVMTGASGKYNQQLMDSLLLPNWKKIQVSESLADRLALVYKSRTGEDLPMARSRKGGVYLTVDQATWDDAYRLADDADDRIMLEAAGRPIVIKTASGLPSSRKYGLRYIEDSEGGTGRPVDHFGQAEAAALNDMPQGVAHKNYIEVYVKDKSIPWNSQMWSTMGRSLARLTREPIYLTNYVDSVRMLKGSAWFERSVEMHRQAIRESRARLGDDALEPISEENITKEATRRAERDAHEHASEMAYDLTMAYVDNPEIRSQLAWQVRNVARFYRALEDFYRRMMRTTQNDPVALLKAAVTFKALDNSGFIWEDEYGERYFIFPGTAAMFSAFNQMMSGMGEEQKVPSVPLAFGARLSMIMPSTDPNAAIPMLGSPWSSITLKTALRMTPTIAELFGANKMTVTEAVNPIEGMLFGEYSPNQSFMQGLLNDVLGPNTKRLIDVYETGKTSNRLGGVDTAHASFARQAMHVVLASVYDPEKTFDTYSERKAYIDEITQLIDITAANIVYFKAITTPLLVATPQLMGTEVSGIARDLGLTGFDNVWLTYLNRYPDDYDKAMVEFTKNHPGRAIFTVSKYKNDAFYESTLETEEFIKNNREAFDENDVGLSYFAPLNGTYGGLSTFYFMRANDIKYPVSVQEMLEKSLAQEGDNALRILRMQMDEVRATASTDEELKDIDKDETAARRIIMARYPLANVDDSYDADKTDPYASAEQIDQAAKYMIESGQDESGMAARVREVFSTYSEMKGLKDDNKGDADFSQGINADWAHLVESELINEFPGNEQWLRILNVFTRNINPQSSALDQLRIKEAAA